MSSNRSVRSRCSGAGLAREQRACSTHSAGTIVAVRRIQRINTLIRDELAVLFQREVQDPLLDEMISITEVETASDLSVTHVYVSVLGDDDKAHRTLDRLRHAARFFRRELAERINLRQDRKSVV